MSVGQPANQPAGGSSQKRAGLSEKMPAPATLFRLHIYDEAAGDLFHSAKQKLAPILKLRDGGKLRKIDAAQTPEDLLDLAPQATGLAQDAWHARMRPFGPQAVAAIAEILPQIQRLEDETLRQRVYNLLIGELRWQSEPGVQALLDGWEGLDSFARSLACIVFGLAGRKDALQPVWEYYQQARSGEDMGFVGALWALIDLGDERAPGELYRFLDQRQFFYELIGFLARAGDQRSLGHLVALMVERGRIGVVEPMMAAAGIAHRVGREATIKALRRYAAGQEDFSDPADVADLLLENTEEQVRGFFAIYFRGFKLDDIQGVMDDLST